MSESLSHRLRLESNQYFFHKKVINHADIKCRQLDGAVDQGSEEDSHQQEDEDEDVDDPNDMPQRPVRVSC